MPKCSIMNPLNFYYYYKSSQGLRSLEVTEIRTRDLSTARFYYKSSQGLKSLEVTEIRTRDISTRLRASTKEANRIILK